MSYNPIHSSRTNHVIFAGQDFTGSLAKDSYIEFAPSNDVTNEEQDAGGYNTSVSLMGDRSGLVTLQLQAQSPLNTYLSQIVEDQYATGNLVVSNLKIIANGTLYLYEARNCHVKGRPTDTKSEDMTGATNSWVFYASTLTNKRITDQIYDSEIKAILNGSVGFSNDEFSIDVSGAISATIDAIL